MDVNLTGVRLCSQVIGAHMVVRASGSIVNIGSLSASIVNRPQWQPADNGIQGRRSSPHARSRRGMGTLWGAHMRTDMSPVDDPRFHRFWIEDAPQQRAGLPEELGPAVAFLASDASSFVTCSVLTADGGYSVF
ncbi:MAG: SDR family oxidoreductase [Lacisediminihabitans sp.]